MNTIAEYIWIDGYGELRSKIKVLDSKDYSVENMPIWNFDGSATRQGTVENSEVILRPVEMYQNPFHQGGYLVMCETYTQSDKSLSAHQSNNRFRTLEYFQYSDYYQPWYGIEQEYYIIEQNSNDQYEKQQGKYYCGINIKGRAVAEAHMHACLTAGLKISGINAEVGPTQWEYQIGPVKGIEAADQLWISRYILQRIAEEHKVSVTFHPKPIGEEWPGSGCHVNFSTVQMRLPQGYQEIIRVIEKLNTTHDKYIQACGEDSQKRLTGDHTTAMLSSFSWGIGSRNTSIRIPKETFIKQCGYFEDRRPSSNMDPYTVCGLLLEAVL
uniref:glutamine synthetase n=1 Tax=Marseillevirus LCMAC201 TaxID=2506605 RepID=A0A481YWQ7_9VIRU|nr:MAG: glutamine synthetase, catalytic domain [Marseillevirus LCMAC201]